ncbi:MAG: hypothetical protein ACJAZ0_000255 [Halioglobus sp.]|jgi:uncharacterized protein involved in exopolysaccharide biosynthesis
MSTEIIEAIPHRPEADSFDFQRSLEAIKQAVLCHKALILVQVILIADSAEDSRRDDFYNHWNVFRTNSLPDEGEMMTSTLLIGKVVDDLELGFDDVYHTFMTHVGYIWVESLIGRTYRSVKHWVFPPSTLYAATPEELERGKTVLSFKDGVILQPVPDTNMGALIARGPSPRIADTLNTMVDMYLEGRQERMLEEADRAYNALKTEVDKALVALTAKEMELQAHYSENNMLLAFEKDKLQVGTWLELKASIIEIEATKAHTEATLKEIDRQLGFEKKNIVGSRVMINNAARVTLRNQIIQLKIALEQTKLRYSAESPEVSEIQAQITGLTRLWEGEEEKEESQAIQMISETYQGLVSRKSNLLSELSGIEANLKVKNAADKQLEETLKALPGKINTTHALQREQSHMETKYTGLSNKLTTAAISRATVLSAPPAIQVVAYADYPEKPYWPKTKLLLIAALVVGALVGIFAAIALDFIYGRVSRYRLSASAARYEVYAIVRRDTEFLASHYSLISPDSDTSVKRLEKL